MNTPRPLAPLLSAAVLLALAATGGAQIVLETPAGKAGIAARAAAERKADAGLRATLLGAKRLPAARKAKIASGIAARGGAIRFSPRRGEGNSLFTNAAETSKDAYVAYFVIQHARLASLAFGVAKDDFVADQLRLIVAAFDGIKVGQLAGECVAKLKAGGYDKTEMQKSLDLVYGATQYGYEQKGGETEYCAHLGAASAEATLFAAFMDASNAEKIRTLLAGIQTRVAGYSAPAGFDAGIAGAVKGFTDAKLTTSDDVARVLGPLDAAFKAAYSR